jgi:ferritin-like protein
VPQGSTTFHEDISVLRPETMDRHRAIVSLQEELEAVDWYDQRIDATGDAELREILRHNRDEEKEHAAMVIEWLRRNDPAFDEVLRRYLFTDAPLVEVEHAAEAAEATGTAGAGADRTLRIGRVEKEVL